MGAHAGALHIAYIVFMGLVQVKFMSNSIVFNEMLPILYVAVSQANQMCTMDGHCLCHELV